MRRYQRRLLIIFGSLLGTFLFFFLLFNLFVLNLFEGRVGSILELIPRDLTFVVTTREPGPGLDFLPETRAARQIEDSALWKEITSRVPVEENFQRLEEMRDQLPVDVVTGVLGSEVLVAGDPTYGPPNEWGFVLYTRVTNLIKIGIDFSDHSLVRGRLDPSIRIERVAGEGFRSLELEQDGETRIFFFARIRDVLVVSNERDLMREVIRLRRQGPNMSLGYAKVFERAEFRMAKGPSEFSWYVDMEALWRRLEVQSRLEKPGLSQIVRFGLEFFNADRLLLGSGVTRLRDGVETEAEFVLSPEAFEYEHEYRIFNTPPVPTGELVDRFAPFVPEGEFFTTVMRIPSKDLFTLLSSQVGERARQLVNDTLREKPVYRDFDDFLLQTGANFGDRMAISVARIDYGTELPYRPVPAVTLYFEVADHSSLDRFLDYLTGDEFALENIRRRDHLGVEVAVGDQKLPLIEWAEEFAFVTIGDTFVLSTRGSEIVKVVEVYAKQRKGLFHHENVNELIQVLPSSVNLFAYWDGKGMLGFLDEYREYLAAQRSFFPVERWPEERMKAEQQIRRADPNLRPDTPEFERQVERILDRVQVDYRTAETARWREWYGERIEWLRIFGRGAGSLAFDVDRLLVFGRQELAR